MVLRTSSKSRQFHPNLQQSRHVCFKRMSGELVQCSISQKLSRVDLLSLRVILP